MVAGPVGIPMRILPILLGLLLAGCVSPASTTSDAADEEPASTAAAGPIEPVPFDGSFSGAGAGGWSVSLVGKESAGREVVIPEGAPAVEVRLSWEGHAPQGLVLTLTSGDSDVVEQVEVREREFQLILAPGAWPPGKGHVTVRPPDLGPAVAVTCSGTLSFSWPDAAEDGAAHDRPA